MAEIASDETLREAFAWLCDRRRDYCHNDEVWLVRERWNKTRPQLQRQLIDGGYCFSPSPRDGSSSNASTGFMSKVRVRLALGTTFGVGWCGLGAD
jgi:hypothetical protein